MSITIKMLNNNIYNAVIRNELLAFSTKDDIKNENLQSEVKTMYKLNEKKWVI